MSYGQIKETNKKLIDHIKTTKSPRTIEKRIVGVWEFKGLMDSTKSKVIRERKIKVNDTITLTEYVERPSIEINKDGTFAEYNCLGECEIGAWSYHKEKKYGLTIHIDKAMDLRSKVVRTFLMKTAKSKPFQFHSAF